MSTQNGSFSFNKSDLVLYVDPSNPKGYDNQLIQDLSYNKGFTFSMDNGATFSLVNNKVFQLDGITSTTASSFTSDKVFTMTSQMSWDVWFKRTNDGNLFNMVYSNGLPYLSFRGTGLNHFYFSWLTSLTGITTQQSLVTIGTYSNNVWYNVTCTLNQDVSSTTSTANIYVNGLFARTTTTAVGTVDAVYQPTNSNRLRIGNFSSPKYPFTGNIGPLRVYNRILSADEILNSYNSTKSRFY
jgi:hypothetical protein